MQTRRVTADFLRQVPYFAELDDAARADLVRRLRVRSYVAGETIVVEGWPCAGLSFVVRGHVRLFRSAPDGREQVLRVIGPGRTFDDAAVFDEGPSAESAAALGPATVGLVPVSVFRGLLDRHPQVVRAAARILASRQRALGQVVEELALRDVTARVAGLLLGCAGRHEHMVEGAAEACVRITHQEIATMIGSVREVVQRALKDLERVGAVKLERARIEILDLNTLERISEGASI